MSTKMISYTEYQKGRSGRLATIPKILLFGIVGCIYHKW